MANLGKEFYKKLIDISNSSGINPADLLLVMTLESGLKPGATNPAGGAVGLIQFMPFILKGVGFSGTSKEFGSLDAVQQLDYVAKYVKDKVALNGGPFTSAAQYYVANFFPAALSLPGVKQNIPSTAIIEKNPQTKKYKNVSLDYEREVYRVNSGLDVDKDGVISYGDLQKILANTSRTSTYQKALKALNEMGSYSPAIKQDAPHVEMMSHPSDTKSIWEKIKSAPTSIVDYINKLLKSSQDMQNFHTICVYGGTLDDRLEFCRIASDSLDYDKIYNKIYTDKNKVNIQIISNEPAKIEADIKELNSTFNKLANRKIDTFLTKSRCTDLPELNHKFASISRRKFLLTKIFKG